MIVILGGGLSGLQLGRRLSERGKDFVLLESRDATGGLCRTLSGGGYSWDVGPHGFYSKSREVVERYYRPLPLKYLDLARDVRVCHRGSGGRIYDVNYPFENGLADLPWGDRLECAAGYCWASWTRGPGEFRNLRQWIVEGLGRGIARQFMLPYNKIWAAPLDEISMDLVKQKIEPERPWNIIRHAFRGGSVGRAYQAKFIYPSAGGAGAIPDAVAAPIRGKIRTGAVVSRLRKTPQGWSVECRDGARVEADSVVSTIPLPELLSALQDPALDAHRPAFAHNDTHFVVVGLKPGRDFARFKTCQWVFFAGPEVFYRVNLMHNFDPARRPVLVAEITRQGAASGADSAAFVAPVLRDLRSAGILSDENDVGFTSAWLEPYTYPIQTVGLRAARDAVEARLRPQGLHLLGRMGRWEYINTDGVFARVDEFLGEFGGGLA
jgi:protoporphyrinogen oxidase